MNRTYFHTEERGYELLSAYGSGVSVGYVPCWRFQQINININISMTPSADQSDSNELVTQRPVASLTLFRAGSERFDSGRGAFSAPPSDLENQASERQAANGVG